MPWFPCRECPGEPAQVGRVLCLHEGVKLVRVLRTQCPRSCKKALQLMGRIDGSLKGISSVGEDSEPVGRRSRSVR